MELSSSETSNKVGKASCFIFSTSDCDGSREEKNDLFVWLACGSFKWYLYWLNGSLKSIHSFLEAKMIQIIWRQNGNSLRIVKKITDKYRL